MVHKCCIVPAAVRVDDGILRENIAFYVRFDPARLERGTEVVAKDAPGTISGILQNSLFGRLVFLCKETATTQPLFHARVRQVAYHIHVFARRQCRNATSVYVSIKGEVASSRSRQVARISGGSGSQIPTPPPPPPPTATHVWPWPAQDGSYGSTNLPAG